MADSGRSTLYGKTYPDMSIVDIARVDPSYALWLLEDKSNFKTLSSADEAEAYTIATHGLEKAIVEDDVSEYVDYLDLGPTGNYADHD